MMKNSSCKLFEKVVKKSIFSDPSFNLKLRLNLLGLSLAIALVIFVITRKRFLPLVIFSVLGNLSFLVNIGLFSFAKFSPVSFLFDKTVNIAYN